MSNPIFREDLLATREEQQGVVYYHIEDPVAKTSFRLYEMEYLMAQKLDGHHSIEQVIQEINSSLHFELTSDDMARFIAQLESMNFLTQAEESEVAEETAPDQEVAHELDQIEEERLLTNALLQIKQGYFGQAKDYFMALRESNTSDKRHNTMINHLSIIGEEPSPSDIDFIWEQIIKLYPQMAHKIGAPVTMPYQNTRSEAATQNSRKGLYIMVTLTLLALSAGLILLFFGDVFQTKPIDHISVTKPVLWEGPLSNPVTKSEITITKSLPLSFGTKGHVEAVTVKEGQQVTKGTVLANLKLPPALQKPLTAASNKARQTEIAVNEKEQAIARNQASLAALTEKKTAAMSEIKKLGSSKAPKDRAKVQKLKKQLAKYNKDLASGQKLKIQLDKQLAQAKKDDRQAQSALNKIVSKDAYKKSTITSPIDGLVKTVAIKNGSPAVKPAITIIDPQEIEVTFTLAADSLTDYQEGQGVVLTHKKDDAYIKYPATVESLSNNILKLKVIDITATLYQAEAQALALEVKNDQPIYKLTSALVQKDAGGDFVWVYGVDGLAHKCRVRKVLQGHDFILANATFKDRDQLINAIEGQLVLREGLPVSVK